MRSTWAVVFFSIVMTLLLCLGGFTVYVRYQHWLVDHQNEHAVVEILMYNLQQGKLAMPPSLAPAPQPTPTPAPKVP